MIQLGRICAMLQSHSCVSSTWLCDSTWYQNLIASGAEIEYRMETELQAQECTWVTSLLEIVIISHSINLLNLWKIEKHSTKYVTPAFALTGRFLEAACGSYWS